MHLEIHHHEHQGDMSVFKCKVLGTYKRSLDRQVAEGVQLEAVICDSWYEFPSRLVRNQLE